MKRSQSSKSGRVSHEPKRLDVSPANPSASLQILSHKQNLISKESAVDPEGSGMKLRFEVDWEVEV